MLKSARLLLLCPELSAFFLGLASVPAYSSFDGVPGGNLLFLLPLCLLAIFYRLILLADSGNRAFLHGFAYGMGLFLGGVSWVYISMADFSAMPAPVAALLTLLFCACLALFPALAAFCFHRLTRLSPRLAPWLFAACLTLADMLRGVLFTGFPWLALGYSQTPGESPFAGYAAALGVHGVGFCAALTAACIAEYRQRRKNRQKILFPCLVATLLLCGGLALAHVEWTTPESKPITVALIQGNVPQSLKWLPEQTLETLAIYREMVLENPAELVLLPETALPVFLDKLPPDYLAELWQKLADSGGNLLLGIPVRKPGADGEIHHYNSMISLGVSPSQSYAKRHLVPFGEFIPFGFHWFLRLAQIPLADFTAGKRFQPPISLAGTRVAVSICYEDAFGEEMRDFLPEAALLVNLSNTAWFGQSLAPSQHLQIARVRALETGRPMLRAGNTGITALINPQGKVAAQLPAFTRAVLRVETQGHTGLTPYVRFGDLPVFLTALLLCLWPRSKALARFLRLRRG